MPTWAISTIISTLALLIAIVVIMLVVKKTKLNKGVKWAISVTAVLVIVGISILIKWAITGEPWLFQYGGDWEYDDKW